MKRWLLKIWRWFFPKKKPIDTIQEFQILQKATEHWADPIVKVDEVIKDAIVEERQKKTTYDTTPNPNKYWRRFKRGDHYYWKKFYSNG